MWIVLVYWLVCIQNITVVDYTLKSFSGLISSLAPIFSDSFLMLIWALMEPWEKRISCSALHKLCFCNLGFLAVREICCLIDRKRNFVLQHVNV